MKRFFQFAIAVLTVGMMVSCGGSKDKEENKEEEPVQEVVEEAVPEEASLDYKCNLFSLTGLEGWEMKPGSGSVRMEKDGASITVSNSTVSFKRLQENYAKYEKREDITAAGLTWKVYVNEKSKLYTLMTDIPRESEKALMVKTFKVAPDAPELMAVLETIKLKKR